jgi:pimeloyl-ACP methyl ester carboxylesterase
MVERLRALARTAAICLTFGLTIAPAHAVQVLEQPALIGETELQALWALPSGEPALLVTLQHGFTRNCRNLLDLIHQFAERGAAVLCLNADMSAGNPRLAEAYAKWLAAMRLPDDQPAPVRWVVAGHSAGAAFALHLGAALARTVPPRLAGAVLLDPVAGDSTLQLLEQLDAPVRVVAAAPGPCNAQQRTRPALAAFQQRQRARDKDDFIGVELTDGSTHVDAEGRNSTRLAIALCRQGAPLPHNAAILRAFSVGWALDLAAGRRDPALYPGGAWFETLLSAGELRPLR